MQINFIVALLPFWSLKNISESGDFRPSFTPVFPEWGWSKSKSIVISHFSIDLTNSDVVSSFVSQAKGVPSHGGGGGWDKDFLFSDSFDQEQPMRSDGYFLRPNIFDKVGLVSPLVRIEILGLDDDNWDSGKIYSFLWSVDQQIRMRIGNFSGTRSNIFLTMAEKASKVEGMHECFGDCWSKFPSWIIMRVRAIEKKKLKKRNYRIFHFRAILCPWLSSQGRRRQY